MKYRRTVKSGLRKCPKCKAVVAIYIEFWMNHTIEFRLDSNGVPIGGAHESSGEPSHVVGYCENCKHDWILRGVDQITELRKEGF